MLSAAPGAADTITQDLAEAQAQPIILGDVVTGGAVLLCDTGDTPTKKGATWQCGVGMALFPSDSITFVPNMPEKGQTKVIFCSEIDVAKEPGGAQDTFCKEPGMPGNKPTFAIKGNFALKEMGTEKNDEITPYSPAVGQPGYGKMGTSIITYNLISDTASAGKIPEPSTLALLASALAGTGLGWLRRRRARTPTGS